MLTRRLGLLASAVAFGVGILIIPFAVETTGQTLPD